VLFFASQLFVLCWLHSPACRACHAVLSLQEVLQVQWVPPLLESLVLRADLCTKPNVNFTESLLVTDFKMRANNGNIPIPSHRYYRYKYRYSYARKCCANSGRGLCNYRAPRAQYSLHSPHTILLVLVSNLFNWLMIRDGQLLMV